MWGLFSAIAGKVLPAVCTLLILNIGTPAKTVVKKTFRPWIILTSQSEAEQDTTASGEEAAADSLDEKSTIKRYKPKSRPDRTGSGKEKPVKISITDEGVKVGAEGEEVILHLDAEGLAEGLENALENIEDRINIDFSGLEDRDFRVVSNKELIRFGDDIRIGRNEMVRGDVVAIFGDVEVEGKITGDVVSIFGNIDIGASAIVNGEVVSVLGTLTEDDDARVRGQTVIVGGYPHDFNLPFYTIGVGSGLIRVVSKVVTFIVGALLFLLIVYFLPERMSRSSEYVFGSFFKSLGIGVLVLLLGGIVVAIMAIILSITIIGIPVAILLVLSYVALIIMGYFVSALALGKIVAGKFNVETDSRFIHGLLGMFILAVLGLISSMMWFNPILVHTSSMLKGLHSFLNFLAVFAGTGAFVMSKAGILSRREMPVLPE